MIDSGHPYTPDHQHQREPHGENEALIEKQGGTKKAKSAGTMSIGALASPTRSNKDCFLDNDEAFQIKMEKSKKAFNRLLVVVLICFIFMIVEVAGGIISNSLAILTDSAHMLSDVAGFVISMFSIWISQKSSTSNYTFGFHRAEVIGALLSVGIIWGMVIWLVIEATHRIVVDHDITIDSEVMLITAFISLACNLFNLVALGHCPCIKVDTSYMDELDTVYKPHGGHSCGHDHGHGHGHDHGHSHGHSHGHKHEDHHKHGDDHHHKHGDDHDRPHIHIEEDHHHDHGHKHSVHDAESVPIERLASENFHSTSDLISGIGGVRSSEIKEIPHSDPK